MSWSFKLGEFFGIAVRVHWTFMLLMGWIVLGTYGQTGSLLAAALSSLLIAGLFSFVVLHEYGHALTARRYGIGTKEITLLPIGGIAQLERMPSDPRQELLVAIAGPAVNVALAAFFAALLVASGTGFDPVLEDAPLGGSILAGMFRVNVVMAVFNLIPALPMDGGRVLRALLATRMPAARATRLAAQVARLVAAGMAVFGLASGNTILMIIAAFVWLGASAEEHHARMQAARATAQRDGLDALFARTMAQAAAPDPPGEWIQGDADVNARRDSRASAPQRVVIRVVDDGAGGATRIVLTEPGADGSRH